MSGPGLTHQVRPISVIGVASGLGGPNPGSAEGPQALREKGLVTALRRAGRDAHWRATLAPREDTGQAQALRELTDRLADAVAQTIDAGGFPLVLGGDHACAVGTWRGLQRAAHGPIGLLWIDAHLDAHTPTTSHSGRLHGMPLACLLGQGEPPLVVGDEPILDPAKVCIVGVRSFEPEEAALAERLGVRVFFMEEVRRRGLARVMEEALARVREGTCGFGVTLDIDAVDPADAPAVGVPAAGGLRARELRRELKRLRGRRDLLGLEVVEFDPHYDRDGLTAALVLELLRDALAPGDDELAAMEMAYGARNYEPIPVILSRGEGCWLWDTSGRRYLDMMSAYSANSFGHSHPRLTRVLAEQAARLSLSSRAFHNDRLPPLLARLTRLTGMDAALPMNTGAEGVETAVKAARKWGYEVKGIARERAQIVFCRGAFHGRTLTAVSLSTEDQYRAGFGPFSAGFVAVPYGDAAALETALTPETAAFIVEPVQGEAGIVVPPDGYLKACAEICRRHRVLLICDEVQTGLGRTGRMLACQHEGVQPDGLILGKALGGGLLPVSVFLARDEVMGVFRPGDHGSTFGGNPLAAAVALEALDLLVEEDLPERARVLGEHLMARLSAIRHPAVREVRGRGLLVGVELDPRKLSARAAAHALARRGVLSKDTHETVLRFAPPLVITQEQIDRAVDVVGECLEDLGRR